MENILIGFSNVFSIQTFVVLVCGVLGGIVIGALPGLTSTMGVALLLPITYGMEATTGIVMLLGIYCGSVYGGSISAILLSTPGTPASAATVLDGHKMALKGEGGRALTISTISSTFGGLLSGLCLIFISPVLAKFALKFGATEFFALAVFGLSIIVGVTNKSVAKGLSAGFFGLLLATVGIDDITGTVRFTFGLNKLTTGFQLIPTMIGLFGVSQVFLRLEEKIKKTEVIQKKFKLLPSKDDVKSIFKIAPWSSIVGAFIGAIPGTGGDIAAWTTYNIAKRTSKHPEKFGTGCAEGIAAPESANNGTTGGTLIPLLTLGVPGDTSTAVLLGAFTLQGLQVGPLLFSQHADLIYTIFVGFMVANILMFIFGMGLMRVYVKILSVKEYFVVPTILVLCIVGSFAINKSPFDILVMFAFGLLGFLLTKLEIPMSPIVLAFILGPMAEKNFRRALMLSKGDYSVFVSRPLTVILFLVAILSICSPLITKAGAKLGNKLKKKAEEKAKATDLPKEE